jgi:hypothetical protein
MNRDSISGRTATIKVGRGPHAAVFPIPKALLCNSSTYFKAALNGNFIEGQTQTIELDDEDPAIFRTYVAWLYQDRSTLETSRSNSMIHKISVYTSPR